MRLQHDGALGGQRSGPDLSSSPFTGARRPPVFPRSGQTHVLASDLSDAELVPLAKGAYSREDQRISAGAQPGVLLKDRRTRGGGLRGRIPWD